MENQIQITIRPFFQKDRETLTPAYLKEIRYRRAIREIREAIAHPKF